MLRCLRKPACIVAFAGVLQCPVFGQEVPTLLLEGRDADEVANALSRECYDAGMSVEVIEGPNVICSTSLEAEERVLDDLAIASVEQGLVRHRVRFALAERTAGVRVWAYPWIEIEEIDGVVLEEDIRSAAYLSRIREVLERIDAALAAGDGAASRAPWQAHYESEQDWHLDAHLRAVEHCDGSLEDLSLEQVDRQLEQAGINPIGDSLRDRCEELYEPVFRWGLARGDTQPTAEEYIEYRASLPRARRCTGQLALAARCR